jgi:hypothetical protein
MSRVNAKQQQQQFFLIGCAAAAVSIGLLAWHLSSKKANSLNSAALRRQLDDDEDEVDDLRPRNKNNKGIVGTPKKRSKSATTTTTTTKRDNAIDTDPTPRRDNLSSGTGSSSVATATTTDTTKTEEQILHSKIEELDQLGKGYFKEKKVCTTTAHRCSHSCLHLYCTAALSHTQYISFRFESLIENTGTGTYHLNVQCSKRAVFGSGTCIYRGLELYINTNRCKYDGGIQFSFLYQQK